MRFRKLRALQERAAGQQLRIGLAAERVAGQAVERLWSWKSLLEMELFEQWTVDSLQDQDGSSQGKADGNNSTDDSALQNVQGPEDERERLLLAREQALHLQPQLERQAAMATAASTAAAAVYLEARREHASVAKLEQARDQARLNKAGKQEQKLLDDLFVARAFHDSATRLSECYRSERAKHVREK